MRKQYYIYEINSGILNAVYEDVCESLEEAESVIESKLFNIRKHGLPEQSFTILVVYDGCGG